MENYTLKKKISANAHMQKGDEGKTLGCGRAWLAMQKEQ